MQYFITFMNKVLSYKLFQKITAIKKLYVKIVQVNMLPRQFLFMTFNGLYTNMYQFMSIAQSHFLIEGM
jgi:hypothetical protein